MQQTIYSWGHSRRINAYPEYFRKMFGTRVQKLSLDAGFTCPNRDGNKGRGGCTFCVNDAFNPSYCQPQKGITQQLSEGIEFHQVRYRTAGSYLAYFQAYSNTYAEASKLRDLYQEALTMPGIIGLVIGTRPDCVNDEILALLAEISKTHYVIIEYGVESCYDDTLERVNRCHNFVCSSTMINKTVEAGLKVGAHFILGLPGDDRQRILDSVQIINRLPLSTIKFHQLQIFKGTVLQKQYEQNPSWVKLFSMEEYIDLIVDIIEKLNPNFVIERMAGEVPPRFLAYGSWGLIRYTEIFRRFEKRIEERNTWQGRLFER